MAEAGVGPIRLAELLGVLSLGGDLGMNQPMEHAMRQCLIALRMAERLGLGEDDRANLYYVCLIAWVGCHVDAYEQAKWFGDDLALKGDFRKHDMRGLAPVAFMAGHLGSGRSAVARLRTGVAFMTGGRRDAEQMLANHWYAADDLAERLGLDQGVRSTLAQTFERWDGKGVPNGVRGAELSLMARIANLADVVEVYHRVDGIDAAVRVATERSGTQFDPMLVQLMTADPAPLFEGLDETTTWDAVIAAEPGLGRLMDADEFDSALAAVADFTDVKSPYTLGHSTAVAELAAAAAAQSGFDDSGVRHVRRAGLVHDLGRLGVSNSIWDKSASLSAAEQERVRLHPYLTERMLAGSAPLAELGATAVQHHERCDGSGYPRGLAGSAMTPAGRILAVADAYRSKLEERPHRKAYSADEAAAWLRDEVRAGRFDAAAADAVLRAAGHRPRRRTSLPAGLTSREVEVLRLLARGLSTQEIAAELTISPATARHHVEHIYAKIGVSNRARASLFALRHGLMTDTVAEPAKMG
jgi:HD-GYP domain-containing protein (c-di-GMP phosphodiesterase class II)